MSPSGKNKNEKPTPQFIEKDVLGLDKPKSKLTKSTGRPDKIFIVIAIIVIIVAVYWLLSYH
jgi:hypothetical protein